MNYSLEKLSDNYQTYRNAAKGTELHEFAMRAINLGVKLPRTSKTLNMYVNDAIGYRMNTEVSLFYSYNCFGTADAISFRKNLLRIHDLKTGVTPASMSQLKIYAGIFCLEYHIPPGTIDMELRIYQNDDMEISIPETDEIAHVMDTIITFDKHLETMKAVNSLD